VKTLSLKYYRSEEAVAATEFALIAPIFLLLILGLVDFGFYILTSMKLESTARAAAEYVLQGGEEDSIQADVVDMASLGLTPEQIGSIETTSEFTCECRAGSEVSCSTNTCGSGDYRRRYVTIQMSMPYDTLFPYPGLPENITLKGRVRLQVE
jgi:Flp pilus assembly protein TadG